MHLIIRMFKYFSWKVRQKYDQDHVFSTIYKDII